MSEPKIPTDHPSGNWQAVDIFLFSNGIHQTPPRKYHLRTDQLVSWNETLKTLAHSQYGYAHHTIDLYTIEGTKITSPLEISNGGAYVAVLLNHNFVPAGYNEYILKATRSREKRFGKFKKPIKSSTTTSPGRRGLNVSKTQPKDDAEYLKGIIEEVIDSITKPTGDRRESNQTQGSKLGTIFSKPFYKRNSNDPNSPTAKKRNLALPRSPLVKSSLKNKEGLPRNNLKVNTGKPSNKASILKENDINLNPISKEVIKQNNSNVMGKTDDETKKIESNEMPLAPTCGSDSLNDKITVTEDNTFESFICDKELIVVKNPDSEMTTVLPLDNSTSVCGNKFKISSILMTPIQECKYSEEEQDGVPFTVINNYVENIFSPEMAVSNDIPTKAKNKVKTNETNITYSPQNNNIETENRLPEDSFKAVVNKGDIVSLNLRIEVKQAEGVGDSNFASISSKQNHIHITERSSQVNIGEIFVESIEKYTKVAEEKPKVVVIPCNCNNNLNYAPADLEDNKYLLLLPTYEQQGERCDCEDITKTFNGKKLSIPNPVKKVYGDTTLLVQDNLISVTQPVTIHTSTTNLKTSTSCTKVDDIPVSESTVKNLKVVSTTENFIPKLTPSKQQRERSQESVCPVRPVPTKTNSQITTKHLVDESTQTEWHTLLMEAKRHCDGRYSFHLPPLQVLKHYSL